MSGVKSKKSVLLMLLTVLLCATPLACTFTVPGGKKPVELSGMSQTPERTSIYRHGDWIIARASLHNHTVYSDGCRTPEDLLELARVQGMAILAYTDHREGKICMGKNKLVCAQTGGVESVGYHAYYDHLEKIQEKAREQDMIVTKGVEVSSPYFFNNGKFPSIVLRGQFKHFTVYSIQDPQVLADMPVSREISIFKPQPIPGDTPYQEFVDYIIGKGGIVHAVHVESQQDDWLGPVHVLTPAPI